MSAELKFRFLALDKLQALTLQRELMSESQLEELRTGVYCVSIPLDEYSLGDILNFYIRQEVKPSECDIILVINKSDGSNPLSVPRLVNDVLKQIDCDLKVLAS